MRQLGLLTLVAGLLFAVSCSTTATPSGAHDHAKLTATGGWCADCNVGYLDGKEVKCKGCYDFKSDGNGWCDGCGKGMANGKATNCKSCAMAVETGTKCPTCNK